jgi:hypothetical protein
MIFKYLNKNLIEESPFLQNEVSKEFSHLIKVKTTSIHTDDNLCKVHLRNDL